MTGTTTTDDDYPITHSSLERKITRDGTTVEICIYRGDDDHGWILEVVDETGGSTVWEDLPSDQEALDLAMKTIDEEGLASFAESMENGTGQPGPQVFIEPLPLDEAELAELTKALGDRSLASVVGMLAAVVSVPEVLPSQLWLGELMSQSKFENAEQAQRFTDLIMRLNNHVATAFIEGNPMAIIPGDGGDAAFCTAYLAIIRAAGIEVEGNDLLQLVARGASGTDEDWLMECDLDDVLAYLYAGWRPRKPPKVGRNDPCHCGSGKKFKKCHGAPS